MPYKTFVTQAHGVPELQQQLDNFFTEHTHIEIVSASQTHIGGSGEPAVLFTLIYKESKQAGRIGGFLSAE